MAGFAPQVLDERTVGYQCDCSEERTKGMLLSLGRRELVKMRDEDPHCEVVCHFCHSRYQYDLNDLTHRPPSVPQKKRHRTPTLDWIKQRPRRASGTAQLPGSFCVQMSASSV